MVSQVGSLPRTLGREASQDTRPMEKSADDIREQREAMAKLTELAWKAMDIQAIIATS